MHTYHHQSVSLLDTVGNTPLVSLRESPQDVDIFAKLESFNPGGSIKDRLGAYILQTLLDRGEITPGGTIIEPTAGNTGIGMAVAANQLDLSCVFVVPKGFSREKEQLMRALGADIVHVPNEDGMRGAAEKAHDLADQRENAIVPQQFRNELNIEAHARTTGSEILEALDGHVGAIIVGIGSAGTLMGIERAIRPHVPDLYVVGVEPDGSTFGRLCGIDRAEGAYKTEGIGTHDPAVAELLDPERVDDIMAISDRAAHREVARLAREEGHLVGSSAGAASVAARHVAEDIANDSTDVPYDTAVTVFPDGSERYLSKDIYGSFDEWEGKS